MIKLLLILLAGLLCEALGVVLLSRGLKEAGAPDPLTLGEVLRFLPRALANIHLWMGVALEAVFFGTLMYLLSRGDVSFVWPLTSLGLVLTTLSARFLLHEHVSGLRWVGIVLIVLGAAAISWSEHRKPPAPPAPAPVSAETP